MTSHSFFGTLFFGEKMANKKFYIRKARIALMREMEKQLGGTGYEDSEEWIKKIKKTHTFSKPKLIF